MKTNETQFFMIFHGKFEGYEKLFSCVWGTERKIYFVPPKVRIVRNFCFAYRVREKKVRTPQFGGVSIFQIFQKMVLRDFA